MTIRVAHAVGEAVTVQHDGVDLLRYVYRHDPEPRESPKPYLHPLRTLAGDVVTGYRPHDHRWHKGLQLTGSYVSGQNFWGGGTYVRELDTYADLDNVGSIRSDRIEVDRPQSGDSAAVALSESLTWLSRDGEPWARERRRIAVTTVDLTADAWELVWNSDITALRAEPLRFGSPATHGRDDAGYSGLFWRGPREFSGGVVLGPDGMGGPDMMGRAAPWLAFQGTHDGADRSSTLVFVPMPDPAGPPLHWFVRTTHPMVNPSWAFHREFELPRGTTLSSACRLIIATGAWNRAQITEYLAARPMAAGCGTAGNTVSAAARHTNGTLTLHQATG